jgi:SAM-dependent methyltransferase
VNEHVAANRALWDEWTGVHERSKFYDLEGFKKGGVRIRTYEREDVGDVEGKTLLHLQCHFGIDSLSWARLGAKVTGIDFSEVAIELARSLAKELDLDATFVCSDLYDLPNALRGEFDIVYTSGGVLGWLPDIEAWAKVVAHFVKPGGIFYITEVHPVLWVFDDAEGVTDLRLKYPYWSHREPIASPVHGSYADPTAEVGPHTEYGWDHGLGEIVTALATAGLRIEFLREMDFLRWPHPLLVQGEDGLWRLPSHYEGELPLFFALKATKPG